MYISEGMPTGGAAVGIIDSAAESAGVTRTDVANFVSSVEGPAAGASDVAAASTGAMHFPAESLVAGVETSPNEHAVVCVVSREVIETKEGTSSVVLALSTAVAFVRVDVMADGSITRSDSGA
jgi:hypothetical protein